ncbi:MAG TPA: APC family permease [Acidobacteriaceae bacterium]|jgi:amino acid transporter|nr:APC family permease [Acidobacteriaceae bacterium]
MNISDLLFGRPLATSEERAECIGPAAGIPIFGLDALSSAAYGPEAALTLLIPLGLAGIHFIVPITAAILTLLVILYFSYSQTIEAYPHGGGSFTVAGENLGVRAGLLAAAALMIDYVLTAAVGISAGVGALISAVPSLQPHTLGICLGILALLTLVNMRGVRDTGVVFLVPTYLFLLTLLIVIGVGLYQVLTHGGHPTPVVAPPKLPAVVPVVSLWLLLKVFSSGCTAMTGVEAVSNGVMAFREPTTKNARKALTVIIVLLILLLAGIALLCRFYGIGATNPDGAGYQSVLSQLTSAVMGHGWFYFVTIGSILLVLALSANTAFADFPRLTRAIALQGYLPHVFTFRGRRLLFSWGIYVLVFFTAALLILFGGVTDRLIPLYAIGAFLAFTLSQAGMVVHWRKERGRGWRARAMVNGLGAVATGITTVVVLVTKFATGAWVTALLVPILILAMVGVSHHYRRVAREMANPHPLHTGNIHPPLVIIPMDRWNRISEKAFRFAMSISPDLQVVHVDSPDIDHGADELSSLWMEKIIEPLRAAGLPEPKLMRLQSPFRYVLLPLLDYVLSEEKKNADRHIAVLVPELVVRHWWENLLHNQRSSLLKLMLLVRGNRRIVVINIPWYQE